MYQLLLHKFNQLEHGLHEKDVQGHDRMNWQSAQSHVPKSKKKCLDRIASGSAMAPAENISSTGLYLKMC